MVRLGADVSLDRQQDPDSRFLLYAWNLAASVSSSRVPECVAGVERRAVSGGTPPDLKVPPPPPRRSATRDPIVWPQCYPSRPSFNKLSPNRLDWNSSVVPTVGNTPLLF